jgi:hypothetical protein
MAGVATLTRTELCSHAESRVLYRYISNPMQLSCALVMTAWGGVLQNPWLVAAGVMSFLYSLGVAAWDEGEDMKVRFGTPWESYRNNVHAWRPRLTPWQSPDRQPARLYISETCGPCSEVRSWFESHGATALHLLAAEDHPVGNLQRITYDPMDGTASKKVCVLLLVGLSTLTWDGRLPGPFYVYPESRISFRSSSMLVALGHASFQGVHANHCRPN